MEFAIHSTVQEVVMMPSLFAAEQEAEPVDLGKSEFFQQFLQRRGGGQAIEKAVRKAQDGNKIITCHNGGWLCFLDYPLLRAASDILLIPAPGLFSLSSVLPISLPHRSQWNVLPPTADVGVEVGQPQEGHGGTLAWISLFKKNPPSNSGYLIHIISWSRHQSKPLRISVSRPYLLCTILMKFLHGISSGIVWIISCVEGL